MRRRRTLIATVGLLLGLSLAACAGQRVEPGAERTLRQLEAVRIINSISSAAMAANDAGKLATEDTAVVLRITWNARDAVERNPATTYEWVVTVLQQASDSLPAATRARVNSYLAAGIAALQELVR